MPRGRPAALRLPESFKYRGLLNNNPTSVTKKPTKAEVRGEAQAKAVAIGILDRLIDDAFQLALLS